MALIGRSGLVLLRLCAWIGISIAISTAVSPNFIPLLSRALQDTFDSVFPAIPFAALLSVILLLRWDEFREVLGSERWTPLRAGLTTRSLGMGIVVVTLVVVRSYFDQSLFASAAGVVLTFFGVSLALNPRTRTIVLPYAIVCTLGTTAPAILQWAVGEPLAGLSSVMASSLVALGDVPVVWHGTQFALSSKTGDLVSGIVTPGCSSLISITTFVGLLALIHVDLKRERSSTLKIAAIGVVVLILLNVVRISILVWIGYSWGEAGLLSAHNWIGYGLFVGFYLVVLAYLARTGAHGGLQTHAVHGRIPSPHA